MSDTQSRPMFSAVSGSARQLFLLLRCIGFSPKTRVQITEDELRFIAEEGGVMQGTAILQKALFTSFQFTPPASHVHEEGHEDGEADADKFIVFEISLSALLDTLQIFGLGDSKSSTFNRDPYTSTAFSAPVLGVTGLCRLSYASVGAPFTIVLQESGITTTSELVTYEPSSNAADIPFTRDQIAIKVIMRAAYLYDAISELASANPERLVLAADDSTFTLSASSSLGSAVVEFHRDNSRSQYASTVDQPGAGVMETFFVPEEFKQVYHFSRVVGVKKALSVASKVSVRADNQGVLSLQFMIENLEGGGVSFVDFRFIPLADDEDGSESDRDYEEGETAETADE
ncbi:Rad1-domain-containing protein [Trichodelitschia bisporula]|uniref:Rad1-domain-containing protein n=1 Tax=Trichodelitschia bisporula TaxID=703511 RepID=A0A6G1I137_9PEZI|nr:Rad1-domain-containing protein [Trichodelitschia bisporula]